MIQNGGFEEFFAGEWLSTGGLGRGGTIENAYEGDHIGVLRETIYQDINTEPGRNYVLTLAISGNSSFSGDYIAEPKWGEVTLATVVSPSANTPGDGNNLNWVTGRYVVRATSELTRVSFRYVSGPVSACWIDGISLVALPDYRLRHVAQILPATSEDSAYHGVAVVGNELLVTGTSRYFARFDISDPAAPTFIANSIESDGTQFTDVQAHDGTVYLRGENKLAIIDLDQAADPDLAIRLTKDSFPNFGKLAFTEDYVYVPSWSWVLVYGNSVSFPQLGRYQSLQPPAGDLAIREPFNALFVTDAVRLNPLWLSSPTQPELINPPGDLPELERSKTLDLVFPKAYVGHEDGMTTLHINDNYSMEVLNTVPTDDPIERTSMNGDWIFALSGNRLLAFNAAVPEDLHLATEQDFSTGTDSSIAALNQFVFVAEKAAGLGVYAIEDPLRVFAERTGDNRVRIFWSADASRTLEVSTDLNADDWQPVTETSGTGEHIEIDEGSSRFFRVSEP